MAVNVEEAKNKTCPLSIGVGPIYHPTDGQGIRDGGPWGCLGHQCMAWRWQHYVARHNTRGPMDVGESGPATGYCGLAGAPR